MPSAPDPLVRKKVRDLLLQSDSFRRLSPERQQEIAHHTVEVANYLVKPDGIPANTLSGAAGARPARGGSTLAADPYELALEDTGQQTQQTQTPKEGQFVAQSAQEGARAAGALLAQVNFPTFVSSLIEGVFHSIVKSSIEQMEAYGRLVADVSKTLNDFRDENVSVNQGRDHLVDQFPDVFQINIDTESEGGPAPKVQLKDGVDEQAALKRVNSMPVEGGPVTSLDDDSIEGKLVPAARTQLATSRQQLLATMVLMGINRIVVTDGRISAKVLFDFQARDNFKFHKTATRFDYGSQYATTSTGDVDSRTVGGESSFSSSKDSGFQSDTRDASYYTKGTYKTESAPVLNLMSTSQESTNASLTTKASLAGQVEVNFKSDYLPLDKMADSFQIGRIQDAAKPGPARGTAAPSGAQPAPAAAPPAAAPPAAAPPSTPAPAPAGRA